MNSKNESCSGAEGRLPAIAFLANPYVPYQKECPPMYEAKKGLNRGTMYPGLDLPFKGRNNQKKLPENALTQLQALGFAIQELALYLDTHCDDKRALALYRQYQTLYKECKEMWKKRKGPLNHSVKSNADSYEWINDPWPWEYCANKEG